MKITVASLVTAVLVLGSAYQAGAQTQPPQTRINTALARAREVGIPVALLEAKIAEGRAKGVSLERIAAAIERRGATLERASQALRGRPDIAAADLGVAADALESGVSQAVLGTLAETAPRDRRVVAIAALTQLVEMGHVPEAALDRVRDALKRGPEALLNLPSEAGAAGGRGNRPDFPGSGSGRGSAQVGPPSSVPAPGKSTQPARPGGPPDAPGNSVGRSGGSSNAPSTSPGPPASPGAPTGPPTDPGAGRGRGIGL
jgi:hypothetical protein